MGECNGTSQFPGTGVRWDFLRILKGSHLCVFYGKWQVNRVPQTWFAEPCVPLPISMLSALRWFPLQVCEGRRNTWNNFWCSECKGCSLLIQLAWHTRWGKIMMANVTCWCVDNITFECHLKNVMVLVHNCKLAHACLISFAWIKCNKIQYLSLCETVD